MFKRILVVDLLIHMTHVPLLLLRPDGDRTVLPHPRRVLVALDGSPHAECILPFVLRASDVPLLVCKPDVSALA